MTQHNRETLREMIAVGCDQCGVHWRYVPRPDNARQLLDAFYAAIPEEFGCCLPEGRHGSAAAGVALSPQDLKWLRGIAAAMEAQGIAERATLDPTGEKA